MLDLPSDTVSPRRPRWSLTHRLRRLSLRHAAAALPPAALPPPLPDAGDEELPAIVVKAREDVRARLALARLGYAKVRSALARHRRAGKVTFEALEGDRLWPTTEFVHDWLRQERKRLLVQARGPFLLAMLSTIAAGLAFAGVAALLG